MPKEKDPPAEEPEAPAEPEAKEPETAPTPWELQFGEKQSEA